MGTELRKIRLVATPDPDDASKLAFRGKHCRDMCADYGTEDPIPVTIWRPMPNPENAQALALRGAADYGTEAAYTDGPSLPDPGVSLAHFAPDTVDPSILRAQAGTLCYWCLPCWGLDANGVMQPRKDLPAGWGQPDDTLTCSITFGSSSCSCFPTTISLTKDGDTGTLEVPCVMGSGWCTPPEGLEQVGMWRGWAIDPTNTYKIGVTVCTHCLKVDDEGGGCHYEAWLGIAMSVNDACLWDDATWLECCSGDDGHAIGPCFAWVWCGQIEPSLMCNPIDDYVVTCYKPDPVHLGEYFLCEATISLSS